MKILQKYSFLLLFLLLLVNYSSLHESSLYQTQMSYKEPQECSRLLNSSLNNYQTTEEFKTEKILQSIQVEGTGYIDVGVFSADNSKPISSAGVIVFDNKVGANISLGVTDKDGIFTAMGLGKGYYNITVISTGFISETHTIYLRSDDDHTSAPFYLHSDDPTSGFIETLVLSSETGKPLMNVNVSLYGLNQKLPLLTSLTDVNGTVNMTDLLPGEYKVVVTSTGYQSKSRNTTIDFNGDGDFILLNLTPLSSKLGYIEIKIFDLSGNPLSGVRVRTSNSSDIVIKEGYTDSLGFYNSTQLIVGEYNISVYLVGYEELSASTTIEYSDDRDIMKFYLTNINLKSYQNIRVLNDIGQPIEGALVKITTMNIRMTMFETTDEDGIVIANNLVVGWIYNFNITVADYISAEKEVLLHSLLNKKTSFFLIPDTPSTSFVVINVMGENKDKIGDSLIEIRDKKTNLIFSGFTDINGILNITNVPFGEFTVTVTKPGYLPQTTDFFSNYNGDGDEIFVDLPSTQVANTGKIGIVAVDTNLDPVDNVYIIVTKSENEEIIATGYTSILGHFNITNLYTGTYEITASLYGYFDKTKAVTIDYAGDVDEVWVSLVPIVSCSIELFVFDSTTDEPLWGLVQYQKEGGEWSEWYEFGEDGHYFIYNLAIGTYYMFIFCPGYSYQYSELTITYVGENLIVSAPQIVAMGDGVETRYALIVAGEVESRFTRDARSFFYTLADHYEFNPANIFLLTPQDEIDGKIVPRDRPTTENNVYWAIEQIAYLCDADDIVVVYWTGHGSQEVFSARIGSVVSWDLDDYLDTITCREMYLFLGPCHSGSFIDNLQESNRAIYTSCREDESGLATDSHSLWPYAIHKAFDPDKSSNSADSNGDNRVSLSEAHYFAYDDVYCSGQHPRRWVGVDIIGDETYLGNQYLDLSMSQTLASTNATAEIVYPYVYNVVIDSSLEISIYVGMFDQEFDEDDISIQVYNNSDIQNPPVENVEISIYYLNGTMVATNQTDSEGLVYFYDIPAGTYSWEANFEDVLIDSGMVTSDGVNIDIFAYPENWDQQGDFGDIRFSAEENSTYAYVENVTISLYYLNGTFILNSSTGSLGNSYVFDIPDGIFSFEAHFGGKLVDEGQVIVDSTTFTLETDDVAPIILILSPIGGSNNFLSSSGILLSYTINESNAYTVTVYLNNDLLTNQENGSYIVGLSTGVYTLRVEVIDVALNFGAAEIQFTIVEEGTTSTPESSSATQVLNTTSPSTTGIPAWIFFLGIMFTIVEKKRKGKMAIK